MLQKWARLDLDNSSLREGFTFTMIARSGRRPGGINETEYFVSLDPESARDCHLYPVWARLQAAEVAAWRLPENVDRRAQLAHRARPGYEARAADEPELFSDPWYDGERYDGRIIGTPGSGTLLRAGAKRDLEDDAVAQIVQDELEFLVYVSPFAFQDVAARATREEIIELHDVGSARESPRHTPAGRYRFGTVVGRRRSAFGRVSRSKRHEFSGACSIPISWRDRPRTRGRVLRSRRWDTGRLEHLRRHDRLQEIGP